MRYRAWKGFDVREVGNVSIGVCLADSNYSDIIHGELYGAMDLNRVDRLAKNLAVVDGSYALAIPKDDTIIFARDPLGTKPLYYARDRHNFLLATDRNALTHSGYQTNCVEPGVLYQASLHSVKKFKFNPMQYETKNYELKEAIENTTRLLHEAATRRLANKKVVLGFGGGIDSTIIARIASDKVTAVTVCAKDSLDEKLGKESADVLNVMHHTLLVDEKTVKDSMKELSDVTHFKNIMHTSIACVVHLLAKYARENGYDALMVGQLADELFGGYARYLKYLRVSAGKARNAMFSDVRNAYSDNFERDEIVASFYTELLLPYAALDFAKYAVTIPLSMKLDKSGARKIILRHVASNLGIPDELVYREKKAMQFSSGIHKIVSRLK